MTMSSLPKTYNGVLDFHESINFGKESQSLGTDTPNVLPLSLRLANNVRRPEEV